MGRLGIISQPFIQSRPHESQRLCEATRIQPLIVCKADKGTFIDILSGDVHRIWEAIYVSRECALAIRHYGEEVFIGMRGWLIRQGGATPHENRQAYRQKDPC
jgi:hypothetical protein